MIAIYRSGWPMAVLVLTTALLALGCESKNTTRTEGPAPDPVKTGTRPEESPSGGRGKLPVRPNTQKSSEPDLVVSAGQLAEDFARDRPTAIQKYAGKWVEATGEVFGIMYVARRDPETNERRVFPVLTVRGAGKGQFVSFGTQSAEPWKSVHPGQSVRIRARGRDDFDPFSAFADGAILSASGPKAPSFTATQLAKDVPADPRRFGAKYSDKMVFVSGKVTSMEKTITSKPVAVLSPAGSSPPIKCDLGELDPKVSQVKVGQQVTVLGSLLVAPDPPHECWLRDCLVTDIAP